MLAKNRGFTLLEVLIALFIFTIVALIMTKSLHSVLDTQTATEKAAGQLTETQMALLLLSRDLEQALDRPISDQEGRAEAAFIGNRGSLSFTHAGFANPDGSAQSSSMQRSRYRLEKNQVFRDTWDSLDQAPHATPHSRLLLTEVKEISFRYLDHKNVFHSYWPTEGETAPAPTQPQQPNNPMAKVLEPSQGNTSKLPRAVEVKISFNHGGELQQIYLLPQQEVPHELH